MTTTVPFGADLRVLLHRASADDVDAFGDFVTATETKAAHLLRVLGCPDDQADAQLVRGYRDAWDRRHEYAATGLSPQAWLLVRLRASATRDGALTAVA